MGMRGDVGKYKGVSRCVGTFPGCWWWGEGEGEGGVAGPVPGSSVVVWPRWRTDSLCPPFASLAVLRPSRVSGTARILSRTYFCVLWHTLAHRSLELVQKSEL